MVNTQTWGLILTNNHPWALTRQAKNPKIHLLLSNLFCSVVQLKEIVKILEKLNGNGRWKWLLHYRENKKLKEDVR